MFNIYILFPTMCEATHNYETHAPIKGIDIHK